MRMLLGTYVEITAWEAEGSSLQRAIGAAFAAIERVHGLMSVHAADSDVSRINRTARRQLIDIHPWTAQVLRSALRIYRATDGLFDCAVGHELGQWGVLDGCGFGEAESGSLADVELSGANTVRRARCVGLDLGGIAKGYAVDRAIAILRREGIRSAVINAGGDLRVMGGKEQPIYIRDPRAAGPPRFAGLLRNGAIATSCAAASAGTWCGRRVSGLVRTNDRTPIVDPNAYSVIAPRCMLADALTKVVAQTGVAAAKPYLDRFGATALATFPSGAAA